MYKLYCKAGQWFKKEKSIKLQPTSLFFCNLCLPFITILELFTGRTSVNFVLLLILFKQKTKNMYIQLIKNYYTLKEFDLKKRGGSEINKQILLLIT